VEYAGTLIAAGLFVYDNQETYYLSGASRTEYRHLPTSYLLHWHVIQDSIAAGRKLYDLGGRNPTANIELFKQSFSPDIATYSHLMHSSNGVRQAKNFVIASLPHLRNAKRWLHRVSFPFRSSEAV
jgi:lipid II:glycine glycyltransferase (peptidoglycan interpeptide bridge formation enzyme)